MNAAERLQGSLASMGAGEPVKELMTPTAVDEPETIIPASVVEESNAPDTVDDDVIAASALELVRESKTFKQVVQGLLDIYDISVEEAQEFAGQAFENKLEDERNYADQMQKEASDSRDKELTAQADADRLFVDNYCLQMNKKKPVTPEDYEKYARLIRAQYAKEELELEQQDKEQDEKFPECPVLPGTLSDLARSMFPSLPFEFKQAALFTHWGLLRSGIDTFALEPHIQPRFYTVLVSNPNRGKTACINESREAMKTISSMVTSLTTDAQPRVCSTPELLTSADSGQFLVEQLFDQMKDAKREFDKKGCLDLAAKALLDPDELADVFEKARTSQGRVSTLFIELLKLHSTNRTGSGTKTDGKKKVENAHLAILAGTQTRKYPMLWTGTGGGADGLRSRFISITSNNPPVPPEPLPSDAVKVHQAYERLSRLAQLPGQNIQLTEGGKAALHNWWHSFDNSKESATRVLEFVKQLLIVLAVTNVKEGHSTSTIMVDSKLVEDATKFGEYIIAVRERLNPGDSWTLVQAQENAIIKWAKTHTTKSNPGSMRDCRRSICPERMPGGLGTFKLAWKNCIDTEMLRWVRKEGKSDKYTG